MTLYHGSFQKIDHIDLSLCRPYTDFGRGFYLTPKLQQARRRAILKARLANESPVINEYLFDETLLEYSSLNVKIFNEPSLPWAEFVFKNREDRTFTHDFDIVVGPVADDDLRLQFSRLKNGEIVLEDLTHSIRNHNNDIQFCFCTEAAIKLLILKP